MKALVVANWKMNPGTLKEAKKLLDVTKRTASAMKSMTVIVCPPTIFVRELAAKKGKVLFGVQNVHFEKSGSYTGEISASQIKDAKASYVIIGHAERRAMGETNDDARKKVDAALAAQLTPILCVGEKARDGGTAHFDVVREQLQRGLSEEAGKKLSKIIIAYEPVWAIGATKAMSPRDMHEMSIFIRKTLVEQFGDVGHKTTVLYGGSIDATNAGAMLREGDVKGFLVGRASSDAKKMTELLRAIYETKA